MLVGVDTMFAIYLGFAPRKKNKRPKEVLEIERRAKYLYRQLQLDSADVVLSTVSVAECLVPVPSSRHSKVISVLESFFTIADLTSTASQIAADLEAARPKNHPDYPDRKILRADAFIIGTLKAAGVNRFFTNDGDCEKLAATIMDARHYPIVPPDLFTDQEIDDGIY
jgi:hypothetical protein